MNLNSAISNVTGWVKKHPWLAGAIAFTVIIATWYLTRPRASSAGVDTSLSGGGLNYVMAGGGDVGAATAYNTYQLQAQTQQKQIEAEQSIMLESIAAQKELEKYKIETSYNANKLGFDFGMAQLNMQSTLQMAALNTQKDMTKYLADLQYSPTTHSVTEIRGMYDAFGRTPTQADLAYWAGSYVENPNAAEKLRQALTADQLVIQGVSTKAENNQIMSAYAKYGRTPTAQDLAYWANFNGDMAANLNYVLAADNQKLLTGG